MNDLTTNISGIVQELGSAFLLAYYLPAVIFLMVNLQGLAPIWLLASDNRGTPVTAQQTGSETADATGQEADQPNGRAEASGLMALIDGIDAQLAEVISAVAVPLLIGLVLLALNDVIIRGFEGKLPWLRRGLLRPWQQRNERRCREHYGTLEELQTEYRRISGELWGAQTEDEQVHLAGLQAGLAQQIDEEHDRIAQTPLSSILPHALYRVAPTTFGNVYALAEEYPYERYGIDAVLFWPRLRTLMQDRAPEQSGRINYAKTFLDLSVNFGFLSGFVFVESVVTWIWLWRIGFGIWQPIVLVLTLTSLFLMMGFYASSIGRIAILGELIKSSYEQYRQLILDAFHLRQPAVLAEEQILWVQLAAFIQRGNDFYFPAKFQQQDESIENRG